MRQEYRELHLFSTTPPVGTSFYSCIWGRAYTVNRDSATDSITEQALGFFDYTRVINEAYKDGVRIFIEMGPGNSCSRMIKEILGDKPHIASAICVKKQDEVNNVLHLLARLIAEGVAVDLHFLYGKRSAYIQSSDSVPSIVVDIGGQDFKILTPTALRQPHSADFSQVPMSVLIEKTRMVEAAKAAAQDTFLRVSGDIHKTLGQTLNLQAELLQASPAMDISTLEKAVLFDREMCMEIATGSLGKVLGKQFADVDRHPSRVRLPDEPLMLVDRILAIEGVADSMGAGHITTEHDVLPNAWYLDNGHIPICIAVEAGQADLFLSAYLGIDHRTKGLAFYRLLDACIVFHSALPTPSDTIRYDIYIDHFFQQDETYLFYFRFESTVNGRPLLTMTQGCAGFFTAAELSAGKGIVPTMLECQPVPGKRSEQWREWVPMYEESFNDEQINALRMGNLVACFGKEFARLNIHAPVGLPGGRMTLVHRILQLDPNGGRFGIGQITGEADINPDDWFLVCHFVDDQVMPGTLMYECCLHTLRVYLLRIGWVCERDEVVYEPIIGLSSQIKCRGQVLPTTRKVQYVVTLKEIGYEGGDAIPYVLADALIQADGKPIVQINNMSLRLRGLSKRKIEQYWQSTNCIETVLFDRESILEFATGKPSVAFGNRYKVFDTERVIARLPSPPYQFLDRIIRIENCRQWELSAGGVIEAEYEVPPDAWYFSENRQRLMPFSVLLEIALQPCGWLAAYLGSALNSDIDMSFRNLGGSGRQLLNVSSDIGVLTTRVHISNVAQSGGMITQYYDMHINCGQGTVYRGNTYFGFFSKKSLANQVGIRNVTAWKMDPSTQECCRVFNYPDYAPYPSSMMRMIEKITLFDPVGGTQGLGFIRGITPVNADAWFFKAHFYQDPVWPGSLGIESLLQLLKVFAVKRWGSQDDPENWQFDVISENEHQWLYRGQIVPTDKQVTVEADISHVDDKAKRVCANGLLMVDSRIIYQMGNFSLIMRI